MQRIKERAKLIRPLLIPLIIYIVLLTFSFTWLDNNPNSKWGITIALLPILPAIFIAFGILRAIGKLDEMERRVLLEAAAFSFIGTFLLLTSIGLLDQVNFPQPNGIYVSALMAFLLVVGKFWAQKKFK
jgi:Kef-type K+ transport system membrane component KefB